MNKFSQDFIRGAQDCQNGKKPQPGQTQSYYRGHTAQRNHDKNLTSREAKQ